MHDDDDDNGAHKHKTAQALCASRNSPTRKDNDVIDRLKERLNPEKDVPWKT